MKTHIKVNIIYSKIIYNHDKQSPESTVQSETFYTPMTKIAMKAQIKVGLLHPNYKHSHESTN